MALRHDLPTKEQQVATTGLGRNRVAVFGQVLLDTDEERAATSRDGTLKALKARDPSGAR
jgi:hypothetical protein